MKGQLRFALVAAVLAVGLAAAPFALAQEGKQEEPPKPATPPPAAAPAPAPAPVSGPWVSSIKIVFDDKAKNDGELVFSFTPEGGEAKQVKVTVAKKMKRDEICRDAAKELTVALGAGYEVDRYDPDKIKIEGKKKAKFRLAISSLTVAGLSVRLK